MPALRPVTGTGTTPAVIAATAASVLEVAKRVLVVIAMLARTVASGPASVRARGSMSHAGLLPAATGAATDAPVKIAVATGIRPAIAMVVSAAAVVIAAVRAGLLQVHLRADDGIVNAHPTQAASRKALTAR